MRSESSVKWIEAGKIIAVNPAHEVLCPECGQEYLAIKDIRSELNPIMFERTMYCPKCAAGNILRLRRPIDEKGFG